MEFLSHHLNGKQNESDTADTMLRTAQALLSMRNPPFPMYTPCYQPGYYGNQDIGSYPSMLFQHHVTSIMHQHHVNGFSQFASSIQASDNHNNFSNNMEEMKQVNEEIFDEEEESERVLNARPHFGLSVFALGRRQGMGSPSSFPKSLVTSIYNGADQGSQRLLSLRNVEASAVNDINGHPSFHDCSSHADLATNNEQEKSSKEPTKKRNECQICGKLYARPSTLQIHMRTHTGEKPYRCHVCEKSFAQDANLKAHFRIHSGEKPFQCSICQRRFAQSSSVTTHMRIHSGQRPYKCPICARGFTDSSTLTKHLRTHTGDKPYKCEICNMRFSQSGNLSRHTRVHTKK